MRPREFCLLTSLCAAIAAPSAASACIVYDQAGASEYAAPYSEQSDALVQAAKAGEKENLAARLRRFQCLDGGELGARKEAGQYYVPMPGTSGCYETTDSCVDARIKNSDPVYKGASAVLNRTIAYEKDANKSDAQKLARVSKTERDGGLLMNLMSLKRGQGEDSPRVKELDSLWDQMEDGKGSLRIDQEGSISRLRVNDQVSKYRQSLGAGD